ncbi:MAG: hypothetical protein AABZ11_07580 [Nitrospinota bacterium]
MSDLVVKEIIKNYLRRKGEEGEREKKTNFLYILFFKLGVFSE